MRAKTVNKLLKEANKRLDKLARRVPPAVHNAPWLHPDLTHAEVRRSIHRLRTGAMRSPDPNIPEPVLADLLEGAIEKDLFYRETCREARRFLELKA